MSSLTDAYGKDGARADFSVVAAVAAITVLVECFSLSCSMTKDGRWLIGPESVRLMSYINVNIRVRVTLRISYDCSGFL